MVTGDRPRNFSLPGAWSLKSGACTGSWSRRESLDKISEMQIRTAFVLTLFLTQILTARESLLRSSVFAQDPPRSKARQETSTGETEARRERGQRQQFLAQELITAKPGGWIFKPGETPRIVWRDLEEVRRLGFNSRLRVRWFDAGLNESATPEEPGRWLAWIEGTAPNGTPFRRALTFYGLPEDFGLSFTPDLTVAFPHFPGPKAPQTLREHQAELSRLAGEIVLHAILDSERGAILVARIAESKPPLNYEKPKKGVLARNE